ncbi:Histone-lysine N-methyltransferase set9 [Colletotrichum sp. SAR 10_99]|nr:Histone-lysine N-methyltransferase set9 [Colletotrichum sp. SAR 10_65]KAI8246193.1 Histone-lysine N-methyltransferase set9 [Colletotrichum sp. SAR 10_96]KAI8247464.1 Histone-lysine N-methyltransferase set9 [Colletotrichum sp. SAR 10_77]KAI8268360.1 Histone-lysine N-methyltransferase set9 [Colletotrichum sp. SAR11_239]KAJ5014051.1 Histone-lysine N-methyltransferase set9 [Colletotrichum sp. SAR 10_99]
MPPSAASKKQKQALTLAQLASYDDFLTDALVDHAFYWTTIPKNRNGYHPSRGIREEEITQIIQSEIVVNKDLEAAERKLLATDGFRKFFNALKTDKAKDDFKRHMRRYTQVYLPDCPFEVNSTNRYTIVSHEAAITARRFIRRNENIKYLAGTQVNISPEEEREMTARKKDFSIIISSRSKCASLFMGPARFANHDCGANAKLMTTGTAGIEIIATRNIEAGEEITVTYAENYFGEDNCECLCRTCENKCVNGWAPAEGQVMVKKSIEESLMDGYSLRRRRRDDSSGPSSRTPSVTPDIRPRVSKSRLRGGKSARDSLAVDSPMSDALSPNKKRSLDSLVTPPITPSKRRKLSATQSAPAPTEHVSSRDSSASESVRSMSLTSGSNEDGSVTDITEPEKDTPEPSQARKAELVKEEDCEELTEQVLAQAAPFSSQRLVKTASTASVETNSLKIMQVERMVSTKEPLTSPRHFVQEASTVEALTSIEQDAPIIRSSETVQSLKVEAPTSTENPAPIMDNIKVCAVVDETMGAADQPPLKKRKYQRRTFIKETTPPAKTRTPGDYTLTPLLLSEPQTAWVRCMNCETAFVQQNAYYTKSSCPRCERHSKLYGYIWPKTERAGPRDKEERILDHRLIHRFLGRDDEARIRGRKRPTTGAPSEAGEEDAGSEAGGKATPKYRIGNRRQRAADEDSGEAEDTTGLRRSGRMRKASIKVAGE